LNKRITSLKPNLELQAWATDKGLFYELKCEVGVKAIWEVCRRMLEKTQIAGLTDLERAHLTRSIAALGHICSTERSVTDLVGKKPN
jgi:hypothetical protein